MSDCDDDSELPRPAAADPQVEAWLDRQPSTTPAPRLSVVVPAYNEERRLPPTLIEMIDFLDTRSSSYEIIVVDDGSTDRTSEIVRRFSRIRPQVRLLHVPENHGKGHAVRMGVRNAQGSMILFADADGATPFAEISRLEAALERDAQVAIGSRALTSSDTTVTTNLLRRCIGRVFNGIVNLVLLPGIADTQCGFKMFTRAAAEFIFQHQRTNRFGFDVELLFIARQAGFTIREIPINWHNVPGSKVNVLWDSGVMLRDVLVLRLRHRRLQPPPSSGA